MQNEKYKKIFDIICDVLSFILIFLFFIPVFQFLFASDILIHSTMTEEISMYYRIKSYFAIPISFILSLILNFRIVKRVLRKLNRVNYKKYILLFLVFVEILLIVYIGFIF